jgi:hypothetical protein
MESRLRNGQPTNSRSRWWSAPHSEAAFMTR